jgi:hypothetical protein
MVNRTDPSVKVRILCVSSLWKLNRPRGFLKTVFEVAVVEVTLGFGHPELGARLDKVVDGRRNHHLVRLVVLLRQHVVQESHQLALFCKPTPKIYLRSCPSMGTLDTRVPSKKGGSRSKALRRNFPVALSIIW